MSGWLAAVRPWAVFQCLTNQGRTYLSVSGEEWVTERLPWWKIMLVRFHLFPFTPSEILSPCVFNLLHACVVVIIISLGFYSLMLHPHAGTLTVDELCACLESQASSVRRHLGFWVGQGVLKEQAADTFVVVEELQGGIHTGSGQFSAYSLAKNYD